jgi:uncharacterized protein
MQELVGYFLFVFIGTLLGLVGGGGSILALPVLVYVFSIAPVDASAYSLFVVGLTSFFGSYSCLKSGDFKAEALFLFAIPSMFSIYLTREWILPLLPDVFFQSNQFLLKKESVILLVFSILILFAAFSMIGKKRNEKSKDIMFAEVFNTPFKVPLVACMGIFVGFISGFVGAGGGFMIIPVLVNFLRIPMKKAIGTSLVIIAVNSIVGFLGAVHHCAIDWQFLLSVSTLSIGGIFIGRWLSNYISGKRLRPIFGWISLIIGSIILVKEIIK